MCLGWNATLFLPKALKINIESFRSQHHRKIKMAKTRSAISLQQATDFSLGSGNSDLNSKIEELSNGEED